MAQQGCCCSGAELIQAGAGAAHAGSESKGGGRLGKRGGYAGPPPHPARVLLPVGVFLFFLFGFGFFFYVFSLKSGAGGRLAVLCRRGALGVFRDFF